MADSSGQRAMYLRWRPGRFSEVVGQDHVTRTLRNAVRSGRVAHAYLFCGPRGTGKTSLARILYKALNCQVPQDGEPCDSCAICLAARQGRALDLVEIDAASNRGIEDIRELRERVVFAPGESRYRVYIIDEAHELTSYAWDAFLKTLEEPPPHAIFVLATTEAHKVPPTIVSRCQRFDFRRIPLAQIRGQLEMVCREEGLEVEGAVLDRVARMARGGLRDALSLLDQLVAYGGSRVDMEVAQMVLALAPEGTAQRFIEALMDRDAPLALSLLSQVADGGADLRLLLDEIVEHLRGVLVARAGGGASLSATFTTEEASWLRETAAGWDLAEILAATRAFAEIQARGRDSNRLQVDMELAAVAVATRDGWAGVVAPTSEAQAPRRREIPTQRGREGPQAPQRPGPSGEQDVTDDPVAGGRDTPASSASVAGEVSGSPPPVARASSGAPITTARAAEVWPLVHAEVARRDYMLGLALEMARVGEASGDSVTLWFQHRFHHEMAQEGAKRRLIEEVFSDVLGQRCYIRCELKPRQPSDEEVPVDITSDPLVRRAMELFGADIADITEQDWPEPPPSSSTAL